MVRAGRLTIETRTVAHAEELCAALAGEEVGRYIGGPEVTTLEAMIARLEYVAAADPEQWGERWLNWVVRAADQPGAPLVGRVEATVHPGRVPVPAEIAYVFSPAWSGRGYATEATAWMLDTLRAEHAVDVAYATVDPANAPSIRLLGRLGFAASTVDPAQLGSYDPGDLVFERPLAHGEPDRATTYPDEP